MSSKSSKRHLRSICPACGSEIPFRKLPRRGHHVTCYECSSLLEVVQLAPLTLEWAFEEPFSDDDSYSADSRYRAKKYQDAEIEFDFADVPGEWADEDADYIDQEEF